MNSLKSKIGIVIFYQNSDIDYINKLANDIISKKDYVKEILVRYKL